MKHVRLTERGSSYTTTSASSFTTPRREENKVNVKKAQDSESPIGEEVGPKVPIGTTHNMCFGPRVTTTIKDIKHKDGDVNAPPAGAQPSLGANANLKKEPGTGMIGEQLKEGEDPKNDTRAQRSWMPISPELREFPESKAEDASYMSLPLESKYDNGALKDLNRKCIITRPTSKYYRINKLSVFSDDH